MYKDLLIFISLIVVLQGCSMAQHYEKPATPVPASWPSGAAYQENAAGGVITMVTDVPWPVFFADERLKTVIETALNNNRDLRIAALNVQNARAMYGIQRSELFPKLNLTVDGAKKRMSSSSFGGNGTLSVEQYSVDFGISSWEIDFFGRLRHLKDQALEEYFSTEEARRSTQISLVFEVANAYLNLAADRENLKLSKTTFDAQQHSYDLIKSRFEGGVSTDLDLQRARTQVDSARLDISRYTQLTAQDINALTLLLGSSSPIQEEWLPEDLSGVTPPASISAGLSSEILLNRPDILAAEHTLKAAYANISAARTAFFPRISLTSAFGSASGDLSRLFSAGTGTWNYAPEIVLPLFDSRLWSAYEASKAQKEIAVNQYEKAIQTAFREVADALAVQGTVDEQISAQQSLVDAFAKSYQLSNMRYTKGVDNYLSVLDAQRSLYASQQQLVTLRLAKFANQARLYAVLGGGSEPADSVASVQARK